MSTCWDSESLLSNCWSCDTDRGAWAPMVEPSGASATLQRSAPTPSCKACGCPERAHEGAVTNGLDSLGYVQAESGRLIDHVRPLGNALGRAGVARTHALLERILKTPLGVPDAMMAPDDSGRATLRSALFNAISNPDSALTHVEGLLAGEGSSSRSSAPGGLCAAVTAWPTGHLCTDAGCNANCIARGFRGGTCVPQGPLDPTGPHPGCACACIKGLSFWDYLLLLLILAALLLFTPGVPDEWIALQVALRRLTVRLPSVSSPPPMHSGPLSMPL